MDNNGCMSLSGCSMLAAIALASAMAFAQDKTAGQRAYDTRCGRCHGGDGRGSDMAPPMLRGLATRDDAQLALLIRNGVPGKMPGSTVGDIELKALIAHTRLLRERSRQRPVVRETVELTDGRKIEGEVLGEGFTDKQMRSNGKLFLLRRAADGKYREVTSSVDWPGYNGDPRGNRYTAMTQINKANVAGMTAKWVFPIPNGARLQGTPVVVKGVMYVTDVNQCFALDAGTGRQIWHWRRPITPGTVGAGSNRGVAVIEDRVFISTDHAHLVAKVKEKYGAVYSTATIGPGTYPNQTRENGVAAVWKVVLTSVFAPFFSSPTRGASKRL